MDDKGRITIERATVVDRTLEIHFFDGRSIKFEDCWLRDHCRCLSCYHANIYQRAKHILDLPDVTITIMKSNQSEVVVTWSDNHHSKYSNKFLSQFDFDKWQHERQFKPILWHDNIDDKIRKIQANEFLNSVTGAKKVFQSLLDFGVAFINEVGLSLDSTEEVCIALGGVQQTLFGGMWQFTTRADHADTAYTNLAIAVHNDNTYFTEAAGLQILHCLEHTNGSGGETILVDGFYGADQLKRNFPEDFVYLCKNNVEAEYVEEGHHHKYSAPVIILDNETKDIVQIRFNVYDRAPMAFSSGKNCRLYYRSLRRLAKYYENVNNQWKFKLAPGTVLIVDNFRVLHGRTGFTGNRVITGSYVARSDWLDRARGLGLIV